MKNGIDPHDKADGPITRRRLEPAGWRCIVSYLAPECGARPARDGVAKGGIVTELNNSRQCYFLAVPPSALRK